MNRIEASSKRAGLNSGVRFALAQMCNSDVLRSAGPI